MRLIKKRISCTRKPISTPGTPSGVPPPPAGDTKTQNELNGFRCICPPLAGVVRRKPGRGWTPAPRVWLRLCRAGQSPCRTRPPLIPCESRGPVCLRTVLLPSPLNSGLRKNDDEDQDTHAFPGRPSSRIYFLNHFQNCTYRTRTFPRLSPLQNTKTLIYSQLYSGHGA